MPIGGRSGGRSGGDDHDLVAACLDGSTEAFGALYRAYLVPVRQTVAFGLGGGSTSPGLVDDLTQEAFVRALEGIATLRNPESVLAWLRGIARRVVADHFRHGSRVRPLDADAQPERPDRSPSPEDLAELGELSALVQGTVAGLSERDAVAIRLTSLYGFSPAEVAAALHVHEGAARVIVHRARRRLRDALVLQVLVLGRATSCEAFASVRSDALQAARHARACDDCVAAAREVIGFAQLPWAGDRTAPSAPFDDVDAERLEAAPQRGEPLIGRP